MNVGDRVWITDDQVYMGESFPRGLSGKVVMALDMNPLVWVIWDFRPSRRYFIERQYLSMVPTTRFEIILGFE